MEEDRKQAYIKKYEDILQAFQDVRTYMLHYGLHKEEAAEQANNEADHLSYKILLKHKVQNEKMKE
jgi:hypothetical protein